MKFYIESVLLWMNNGNIRSLEFKTNKVNIITGDSETGKSSILSIIDYCFFASKAKIPQVKINENVSWYGIKFNINGRGYTIARGKLNATGKVSMNYFFSSTGEVPNKPIKTIQEQELKKLISAEFSIDDNVVIPYGGNKIKQGDKISLRYFMMFNYQDEDTINDSSDFFVKQNDEKYREALTRIFDLAIGISTVEEVIIEEKIASLEKKLKIYNRKQSAIEKDGNKFEEEIWSLIKTAKSYNLINNNLNDFNKAYDELKSIDLNESNIGKNYYSDDLDKLFKIKSNLQKKIKKYSEFESEYVSYKKNLSEDIESLRPIEYIVENYNQVIESPLVREFLTGLKGQLEQISLKSKEKYPIDFNVKKQIKELEKQMEGVTSEIRKYSEEKKEFNSDYERILFMGEIKGKLSVYEREDTLENYSEKIKKIESDITELDSKLENRDVMKSATIRLLESITQMYLVNSKEAMGTYGDYLTVFNYKEKSLQLQEPDTVNVLNVVGSSSNYMFLHLCLFLGLHELVIKRGVPYVPSFLVLDQPSRPYYDNNSKKATDKGKITIAMKLLNDFINHINKVYEGDFQLIVIEKIPKDIWIDAELKNFNLVAEFYEGEKLIRKEDMD